MYCILLCIFLGMHYLLGCERGCQLWQPYSKFVAYKVYIIFGYCKKNFHMLMPIGKKRDGYVYHTYTPFPLPDRV